MGNLINDDSAQEKFENDDSEKAQSEKGQFRKGTFRKMAILKKDSSGKEKTVT